MNPDTLHGPGWKWSHPGGWASLGIPVIPRPPGPARMLAQDDQSDCDPPAAADENPHPVLVGGPVARIMERRVLHGPKGDGGGALALCQRRTGGHQFAAGRARARRRRRPWAMQDTPFHDPGYRAADEDGVRILIGRSRGSQSD